MSFSFQIKTKVGQARTGELTTPHGKVLTPTFMPVGTQASVKSLSSDDLVISGAQIILGGNTYHMYLRPGLEVIKKAGGMHKFMNWEGPMLTDSGGFQVFSLGMGSRSPDKNLLVFNSLREDGEERLNNEILMSPSESNSRKNSILSIKGNGARIMKVHKIYCSRRSSLNQITDNGVWFASHLDGSRHFMSPEKSVQTQKIIGADIIMAFDECTPDNLPKSYVKQAMERTHSWLVKCKKEWLKNKCLSTTTGKYQALFGIIQGGIFKDLRKESAKFVVAQDLPGIAVGGETIGYNMEKTLEIIEWLRGILPKDKPLYTMGVGRDPQDIIDIIKLGIDLFDCVAPTRLARNGALYNGRLKVGKALVARRQNFDVSFGIKLAKKDRGNNNSQRRSHCKASQNLPTSPLFNNLGLSFESEFPKGRLNIGQTRFKTDQNPIDQHCDCLTCRQGYSRAYLHHLFRTRELLYYRLASIHNVRFMIRICQNLRKFVSQHP